MLSNLTIRKTSPQVLLFLLLLVSVCRVSGTSFVSRCSNGAVVTCSDSEAPFYVVGPLAMSNCVLVGCPQIIIQNPTASISISNVQFINGTANNNDFSNGGCFYIENAGSVAIRFDNVLFYNNQGAARGGAFYLTGPATNISLNRVTFDSNKVQRSGGCIYATQNASFSISSSTFRNNHAPANGGAILALNVNQQPITVTDTYFGANVCGNQGGIIFIMRNVLFNMDRCIFETSTATYGGAIALSGPGQSILVRNSTFTENFGSFQSSAIDVFEGSTISFQNCIFQRHHSVFGGVMSITNSMAGVVASNCSFIGNSVDTEGGVIFVQSDAYFNGTDCSFLNNTAGNGGAFSILSPQTNTRVSLNNSVFRYNQASGNGGAISSFRKSLVLINCLFEYNSAGSEGGAITVTGNLIPSDPVVVQRCTFQFNTAGSAGGSFHLSNGVPLQISDSKFSSETSNGQGGSMFFQGPTTNVTLTRVTIQNCFASFDGGAIMTFFRVQMTTTNCLLQGNSAGEHGGALYIQGPASAPGLISFNNCNFTGNSAGTLIVGDAGQAIVRDSQDVTFSGCSFSNSVASGNGGALEVAYASSLSLINCVVSSSSRAGITGGFLQLLSSSSFTATGSTFNLTNFVASSTGHFISSVNSALTLQGNNIFSAGNGNTVINGGSIVALQLTQLSVDVIGPLVDYPSVFELSLGSRANVGQFVGTRGVAGNKDSSWASISQNSTLNIGPNSSAQSYSANGGDFFHLQSSSSLTLSGFSANSCSWTGGYFLVASEGSSVSFSRTLITGSALPCLGAVRIDSGSSFWLRNSAISNVLFTGCGTVSVTPGSQATLGSTALVNNSFYSGSNVGNQCAVGASSDPLSGYGGAICAKGIVTIGSNCTLANNSALAGGAIFASPTASVSIGPGPISITGNNAAKAGGAFYISTSIVSTQDSATVVSGNTVTDSSSFSTLAFYQGYGYIQNSNAVLRGSIFVQDSKTASYLITSSNSLLSPSNSSVNQINFRGKTSYVQAVNPGACLNISLSYPGIKYLPPVSIKAFDYFGNAALFDPNQIVSVSVQEVSRKAPLSGELVKSILDNVITFSTIQVLKPAPGNLTLQFLPVPGTVNTLSNAPASGYVNIQFLDCTSQERFVSNMNICYPIAIISSGVRITIACCAIIAILLILRMVLVRSVPDAAKEKAEGEMAESRLDFLGVNKSQSSINNLSKSQSSLNSTTPSNTNKNLQAGEHPISDSPKLLRKSDNILNAPDVPSPEIVIPVASRTDKYAFMLNIGAIIGVASGASQATNYTGNCLVFLWLENIGFSLVIGSLCVLGILRREVSGVKIEDWILLSSFVAFQVLWFLYLVIWSAIQPLQPSDQFIASRNVVLIDKCDNSSIFLQVFMGLKMGVTIIVALISTYSRKKTGSRPAPFLKDSQLIGFCTYNWLVFGPLMEIIAIWAISTSPELSFFVQAFSLIIPNITTVALIGLRRVKTSKDVTSAGGTKFSSGTTRPGNSLAQN